MCDDFITVDDVVAMDWDEDDDLILCPGITLSSPEIIDEEDDDL